MQLNQADLLKNDQNINILKVLYIYAALYTALNAVLLA